MNSIISDFFRVTFNIPGCLPESDPMYFDSLHAARCHVAEEWGDAADGLDAWDDTSARIEALAAISGIEDLPAGADHPEPGNLYRWTIEQVDAEDIVPDDETALQYLAMDSGTVPCSRYGTHSVTCAEVAVLVSSIMREATGEPTTFRGLDSDMGLVVNDSDDVARLLADNATPEQLDAIGQDRDSVLAWIHGDKEDNRLDALRAYLIESGDYSEEEVSEEDIEPESYDESSFDAFGNCYRVLDDEEADSAVVEYIEQTIYAFTPHWLARYMPEGIDAEEIKSIRGDRCKDANPALLALVNAGDSDLETLARDAADEDGRGHFLAGYDFAENEIEHAGRTWYVYRTN